MYAIRSYYDRFEEGVGESALVGVDESDFVAPPHEVRIVGGPLLRLHDDVENAKLRIEYADPLDAGDDGNRAHRLHRLEHRLFGAAVGADPILGKVFEGGPGRDARNNFV